MTEPLTESTTEQPLRVVVDCDPGLDDAVALMMLLADERVELVGLTTVAGNISLAHSTDNAGRLLDLLAVPAPTPFHEGHSGPMGRVHRTPDEPIHGPGGLGDTELPAGRAPMPGHAVDWLDESLRRYPGELTILAIAPLTNIASLLHRHPESAQRIKEVVVMGGAAYTTGNVTASAEFNIYADPEAARYVCESGVPLRIVPLDVTRTALVPDTDSEWIDAQGGTASVAAGMVRYLIRGFAASHGIQACALHDAVAVAALLEPDMMRWQHAVTTVECGGEFTRGQLVVDPRARYAADRNARIATSIDGDRFRELVRTLLATYGNAGRRTETLAGNWTTQPTEA